MMKKTPGESKSRKTARRGIFWYDVLNRRLGSGDTVSGSADYGIYIFPEDAVVGADAVEALGLHNSVFEYEIHQTV